MKKLVITGATGFLGLRAVQMLKAKGYAVVGLGRNPLQGKKIEKAGAEFRAVDLSDEKALNESFAGADAVVHCAALSSPWGKENDFFNANVLGTKNVIQAAQKNKIQRLVHISTPSIYMDSNEQENILENNPLPIRFVNSYAKTKWQAELEVDRAFAAGLATITLRPQGIFGPEDPNILPRLLRMAARGKLPVIGGGKTKIDFTYVDNVVDAIELALTSPESTLGKKYNITNGDPRGLYDVFEKLLKDLGFEVKRISIPYDVANAVATLNEGIHRTFLPKREPTLTCYSVGVLSHTRTLSIEAAKKDLHYQPRISIDEGLKKVVKWYHESSAKAPA